MSFANPLFELVQLRSPVLHKGTTIPDYANLLNANALHGRLYSNPRILYARSETQDLAASAVSPADREIAREPNSRYATMRPRTVESNFDALKRTSERATKSSLYLLIPIFVRAFARARVPRNEGGNRG